MAATNRANNNASGEALAREMAPPEPVGRLAWLKLDVSEAVLDKVVEFAATVIPKPAVVEAVVVDAALDDVLELNPEVLVDDALEVVDDFPVVEDVGGASPSPIVKVPEDA